MIFGEAFTGDIAAFDKTCDDENTEENIIKEWIDSLPEPYREELAELFAEMKERKTTEAKLYKALDKMEAVIQHNEADISTWLPLEYDLQFTYGEKETAFSEVTRNNLKKRANEDSVEKMKKNR